jgi:hypothetical protein
VTFIQHVANMTQCGKIKARLRHKMSTPWVSAWCRHGVGMSTFWALFRTILSYLRHKYTKFMEMSTPPTPPRHPADTLGVAVFRLNNPWYQQLYWSYGTLVYHSRHLIFFIARDMKIKINTLMGVDISIVARI